MDAYKHILLAADFSEHGEAVALRAKDIAGRHEAKLSIVHIMESIPITDATYGPIIPYDMDLTKELMDAAKQRVAELGKKLNVAEADQWIEMGSSKLEVVRIAEENNVDLIVAGSHGRHGFALLLGSTVNGILHHATCDVLAVRLHDD
jgi:universal stress protein A